MENKDIISIIRVVITIIFSALAAFFPSISCSTCENILYTPLKYYKEGFNCSNQDFNTTCFFDSSLCGSESGFDIKFTIFRNANITYFIIFDVLIAFSGLLIKYCNCSWSGIITTIDYIADFSTIPLFIFFIVGHESVCGKKDDKYYAQIGFSILNVCYLIYKMIKFK